MTHFAKRNVKKQYLCIAVTLFFASCAPTKQLEELTQRQRVLEERVISLEAEKINVAEKNSRKNDNTSTLELNKIRGNLTVLSGEIKKIREDLTYTINQVEISSDMTTHLSEKSRLLEKRLGLLEIEVDKQTIKPGIAPAPETLRKNTENDEEKLYQGAINHYQKQEYDTAVKQFLAYRKQFPKGRYIDKTYYFIGGAHFRNNKNNAAAKELERLILLYPTSDKFYDALYLLGVTNERLDKKDDAIKIYRKLITGTGDSKYKLRAEERIRVLESK